MSPIRLLRDRTDLYVTRSPPLRRHANVMTVHIGPIATGVLTPCFTQRPIRIPVGRNHWAWQSCLVANVSFGWDFEAFTRCEVTDCLIRTVSYHTSSSTSPLACWTLSGGLFGSG
ncbi:uncharacterized protein ACO6RY_15282 [Pungitius sinensis]